MAQTESQVPQPDMQALLLTALRNELVDIVEKLLEGLAEFVLSGLKATPYVLRQQDDPYKPYEDAVETLSEAFRDLHEIPVSNAVRTHLNNFPYRAFWNAIDAKRDQVKKDQLHGYDGKEDGSPCNHREVWMLGCALHPSADRQAALRAYLTRHHPEWIKGLTVITPVASIVIGGPVKKRPAEETPTETPLEKRQRVFQGIMGFRDP